MDFEKEQRSKIEERWETPKSPPTVLRFSIFVSFLFTSLILAACTPIRPVAKIGLVAPFEGLYRQSGYAALDAMRSAIDDSQADAVDLLPVALDGSADAERTRRAVEKLLADGSVQAVIGPLSPAMVAATGDLLADRTIQWIVPYAVDPAGGFADPLTASEWATGLVAAVAAQASQSGVTRLALAGDQTGWPELTDQEWSNVAGIEVAKIAGIDDVYAGDVLFWMGSAANGAAFLNELRRRYPDLPFWLGPQGEDPVFAERAESIHQTYWATWVDLNYNRWASDRSPASPGRYQIYRATATAASRITEGKSAAENDWLVQLFVIGDDGASTPLDLR